MSYEGYKQGIHKSKGGLIRSFVKLEGNQIEDIAFSGDFFLFPETAIEQIALEYGVFNIALPTRSFVKSAHAKGYVIEYFGTCCGVFRRMQPASMGIYIEMAVLQGSFDKHRYLLCINPYTTQTCARKYYCRRIL